MGTNTVSRVDVINSSIAVLEKELSNHEQGIATHGQFSPSELRAEIETLEVELLNI